MTWSDGLWNQATYKPAHHGRVGRQITPFAVVVHTTDMMPGTLPGLLRNWTMGAGSGDCAHFVIGESEVSQLVPIDRNANHAGGDGAGVFVDASGVSYYPNHVAVGIEIHNAGGVRLIDGKWKLVENSRWSTESLPDADVIPDPARPGRGWHRVTEWQYDALRGLLADLETVLAPMPRGLAAKSTVEAVPAWGKFETGRVVGHVSLDPRDRSDPWPATCDWLRALPRNDNEA